VRRNDLHTCRKGQRWISSIFFNPIFSVSTILNELINLFQGLVMRMIRVAIDISLDAIEGRSSSLQPGKPIGAVSTKTIRIL